MASKLHLIIAQRPRRYANFGGTLEQTLCVRHMRHGHASLRKCLCPPWHVHSSSDCFVAQAKGWCDLKSHTPHAGSSKCLRRAFARICIKQVNFLLVEARKLATSREILLWMTPSEAPKALQASECSELLDPMRASCWISAQH